MKRKCLAIGIILLLLTTGISSVIASTEKVFSKETIDSQFLNQILTRKDIPVLSNIIALSMEGETREILKVIRDKVSISGSVTELELRELFKGFGWKPFVGLFYIYADTDVFLIPGYYILNLLNFYIGPFIVGSWCAYFYHFFIYRVFSEGIVFSGMGIGHRTQLDPGARIFTNFIGICTLGFYKLR